MQPLEPAVEFPKKTVLQKKKPQKMSKLNVGAVTYLNAKPLVVTLADHLPDARIVTDYPSRLADALADGRLDVALIPVMAYLERADQYEIVSDACIACDGPVLSVRLYLRCLPDELKTVALDEGSRTSAALTKILLDAVCPTRPTYVPFPLGQTIDQCDADAVLMIGDRAIEPIATIEPIESQGKPFVEVWDLGEHWKRLTGLPMVFAMWVARAEVPDLDRLGRAFAAARDEGIGRFDTIAHDAAASLKIPETVCLEYLRDYLTFQFGDRQRAGLKRFAEMAAELGLLGEG